MSRHANDGQNCTEPFNLDFADGTLTFTVAIELAEASQKRYI